MESSLAQIFETIRIIEGNYLKGRILGPTHRDAGSIGSGGAWESALLTSPQDVACAGGLQSHREDPGRCPTEPSVRAAQELIVAGSRGPCRVRQEPTVGPTSSSGPRFAKYYKLENGSEYRTLLKAFGIRFDVLVYGNVSARAWQLGGQGRKPRPTLGPRKLLGGMGRVLPLTSSEALSWSHPQSPQLCHEGWGLLLQGLSSWESKFSLWPPPCPAGLSAHPPRSCVHRLASSTSSPPSSALWQPSPPWEW